MAQPAKPTGEQAISDASVREATGKSWKQWHALLDKWGAKQKPHKEIARFLRDEHDVNSWWSQTITVRYERDRGLREVGQRADKRFELSVQRTIAVNPQRAFEAISTAREWNKWFTQQAKINLRVGGRYSNADKDEGEFLVIDPPRRLRFTWENARHCPGTVVQFDIAAKGAEKCAVCVTHGKLASQQDREHMKGGWTWAMDSLKSYLETGKPIPAPV